MMRVLASLATAVVLASVAAFAQTAIVPSAAAQKPADAPRNATPLEPVAAILDAFRSHTIVALSEGEHGNEQGYALRLALIRDPRFSALVNDIVVECGNSRFQDVVDRFVNGGEVPDAELRKVWLEDIEPGTACDRPIYEGFVREARAVNANLPTAGRLRVLMGEPPVDWTTVHRSEDMLPMLESRDGRFPAEIIKREVLAKGRRALVVYGSGHFWRRNLVRDYKPENTIVTELEQSSDSRVFSIWASELPVDVSKQQSNVAAWPVPSFATLKGTVLGAADFTFFYPWGVTTARGRTLHMEDQFDAMLYLGAPSAITIARLPKKLCSDPSYMTMRLARLTLFGMQDRIDGLKRYCAAP